jgi:hypothetical protein
MNAVYSCKKFEGQGERVLGLLKEKYPEESTRRFLTIKALKNGLKRLHSNGIVIVVVSTEEELLELAHQPAIPQSMAIVVILPDRNEGLLRDASALSPALIWFDDNSVEDLMAIIHRIKIEQQLNREEMEELELSWSEDYPHINGFLWHPMSGYGTHIQSLAEIVYYA